MMLMMMMLMTTMIKIIVDRLIITYQYNFKNLQNFDWSLLYHHTGNITYVIFNNITWAVEIFTKITRSHDP